MFLNMGEVLLSEFYCFFKTNSLPWVDCISGFDKNGNKFKVCTNAKLKNG
jgi:hypothetical protein